MVKKAFALILAIIMIVSTLPLDVSAASSEDFQDTPAPEHWSAKALKAAVENGLLRGSDGKLNPGGNLLRAEMAAVINRAFGAIRQADLSSHCRRFRCQDL
ncbi:MAG TPA: S-layer homology domain-containing protein [Clostridiaceae bacterium]|nr:S-layer homology domain-containing protein [Clostridiaceae bacterium]